MAHGVLFCFVTPLNFAHPCRPQPTADKICTAAAASILVRDLAAALRDKLRNEPDDYVHALERAADGVDAATETLMYALAERRERSGRPGLRLGVGKNVRPF